ncbi:hypothetical protein GCM10008905_14530 [Clostridium malenominatum]|uniref:Uncharacterized protein n=1 Tax=Clostridium malenominatum TaxID=1539 RepID=A0ABP3U5N0_9CLOT
MKFKFKTPTFRKKELKTSFKNLKFPFKIKKVEKTNKKNFKLFSKSSETNIINSLKKFFHK